jgi:hypothetical protein
MKSLITALVVMLAMYVSAQTQTSIQQTPDTKQTVTTQTKTTVTKDGKTTKKITKKISKTAKKECTTKSGCCDDDSKGQCSDKKDSK